MSRTPLPLVAGLFVFAVPSSAADPTGREAVERFAATIRAFPHYTCKYTVSRAEAASFEDARAGRWTGSTSVECVLRVDGDRALWTGRTPANPVAGYVPGPGGLAWAANFTCLVDGELGFTDAKGLVGAWNLLPPGHMFDFAPTPFGVGMHPHSAVVGSPHRLIDEPGWQFVDEGTVEVDGRRLVRVRFSWPFQQNGRAWTEERVFHLDPTRGYLPAYRSMDSTSIKKPDGRPFENHYLLSARDCGEGCWFPERSLFIRPAIAPG